MELGLLQAGKAARRGSSSQIHFQARCSHGAPAPLGFLSHTHLIMIAGLSNKLLFNSKSIWQPLRAQSAGCQSQWLPHSDQVYLWYRVLKPCHSTPHLGTQLSHRSPTHTCHWCQWSPHALGRRQRIGYFPSLYRSGFLRFMWHLPSLGCVVSP